MKRVPEPELMEDPDQALAYAQADFDAPHELFIELFRQRFGPRFSGTVLDLGCGPGDIGRRFLRAWPQCRLHGVDGSRAMLDIGRRQFAEQGLAGRVTLVEARLPGARLPRQRYDAVISNSLLHHLADPATLWQAVKQHAAAGAPVLVMDLRRPASERDARRLVDEYAAGEPGVLRDDFLHSLCAAYRPDEVERQLADAGQEGFRVEALGDRHLLVWGRAAAASAA